MAPRAERTFMVRVVRRRSHIERIENRIDRLRDRATELLDREAQTTARLEQLQTAAQESRRRLRSARLTRAISRQERRLERLRSERAELVENEIRTIMLALEAQSRRTRERLDRELERLAPVEQEWTRLRATFDALDASVEAPALAEHAARWHGVLTIPDFPVQEGQGYVRPFPPQAVVF